MKGLRKIIGLLLVFASLVPVLSLQVIATEEPTIGMSVTDYDAETNVVRIHVSTQPLEDSDFVTDFPSIQVAETLKKRRPSAELANQERRDYVSIPLYYQTDYPDILYGDGTVATDGCSITSLAMVATYLTGYEYLPDELAYYFGGRAVSNMERLENGAKTLGLPYEKPANWHHTLAALKEGKYAIVLVDSKSKFTDKQHFIVLTGVTVTEEWNEAGEKIKETVKVHVHDPFAPNYEIWDLVQGFEYGFSESDIIQGYQGAWVFDKAAMPEEITRYFEAEPEQAEPRYPEIELSFAERQLLARVVWAEARGESEEGQQAVAEVVLNRMASPNFSEDLRDVIYGENQFRSVAVLDQATPGQAQYEAIEKAIYGPYILPEDVVFFATYETNDKVWGTIGGHIFCYEHDKDMSEAEEMSQNVPDDPDLQES